MASYDIRPLQLHILGNLMAFDRMCREHHLRYYIVAGTMLGAVRHKGFIPWDDDLDVGMPRKDYDLLMAHAKEWMPAPYEVVAYETDSSYPLPFAKIQDASTTLIERMHLKYLGGVYIDVFPLDGMTANPLLQRLHLMRYFYYKKVIYFLCRDPYRHGHGPSSWIPLLCRKFYTLSGVQKKMQKMQKTYDFDSSTLVIDHDFGRRGIMPREVLGTPTEVVFEGKTVMGVEQADVYLTSLYGDYMTIPPGPKRKQHDFHLMDLHQPYRESQQEIQ
ncbi:MAG: LicD family protein [Bacteroidales bacterium]|nr:LicD family protein [Bacteroidales bacterium]